MANLGMFAVCAGLIGVPLRILQWSAYDSQQELFVGNSIFLLPLFVWIAGTALIFFAQSRKLNKRVPTQPFYCPQTGYMVLMTLSAFLFMGAGMLGLLKGFQRITMWKYAPDSVLLTEPLALLVCALLCLPSGAAVLMMGKESYRGAVRPISSGLSMLPAFTGAVWLIAVHMEYATDPVMLRYGFLMAAVIFLLLAVYDVANTFFEQHHPVRFPFCAAIGMELGIIACLDRNIALFSRCLLLAFLLYTAGQFNAYLDPKDFTPADS